jgi:fructose-1,6-bisphosphatase/inositol monophosphatase family enzyme
VLERVGALMREVAAEAVLPRFQRLAEHEILEKSPGDLVTVADREAERLLEARLAELVPGSLVVGEEAVSSDPSLLSHLANEGTVWLVDPVDGTSNFAAGRAPFAMMVALLKAGRTVAAWILDPLEGAEATAELGSGAFVNGTRAAAPSGSRPAHELRGSVAARYLPPTARSAIAAAEGAVGEVLPGRNCAGYEYPAIARDDQQFAFFWRMLAWDHAPGVLFIEECGGTARHLDGSPYDPTAPGHGVLVAQNIDTWQAVRAGLFGALPG